MCRNPFAGRHRLDKCNLQGPSLFGDDLVDVASDTQPERTLWASVIADAVFNYQFWALGRNGSSLEEFWHACEFLFNVRASKPGTWWAARIMRDTYVDEDSGRRVTRVLELSDAELRGMCLDIIWDSMCFRMTLETFTDRLQSQRRHLLSHNWRQVSKYLGLHRSFAECESALVNPSSPDELINMLHSSRTGLEVAA